MGRIDAYGELVAGRRGHPTHRIYGERGHPALGASHHRLADPCASGELALREPGRHPGQSQLPAEAQPEVPRPLASDIGWTRA